MPFDIAEITSVVFTIVILLMDVYYNFAGICILNLIDLFLRIIALISLIIIYSRFIFR